MGQRWYQTSRRIYSMERETTYWKFYVTRGTKLHFVCIRKSIKQKHKPEFWTYWNCCQSLNAESRLLHVKTKMVLGQMWLREILLMGRIYEACHWDGLRWNDIWVCAHVMQLMKIGGGIKQMLRFCFNSVRGCNLGAMIHIWTLFHKDWFRHLSTCTYIYIQNYSKVIS
jgi:hypothetical protein